jgi:hypothetical protein
MTGGPLPGYGFGITGIGGGRNVDLEVECVVDGIGVDHGEVIVFCRSGVVDANRDGRVVEIGVGATLLDQNCND